MTVNDKPFFDPNKIHTGPRISPDRLKKWMEVFHTFQEFVRTIHAALDATDSKESVAMLSKHEFTEKFEAWTKSVEELGSSERESVLKALSVSAQSVVLLGSVIMQKAMDGLVEQEELNVELLESFVATTEAVSASLSVIFATVDAIIDAGPDRNSKFLAE